MDAIIQQTPSLHGTLDVPPDKAIGQRAVLLAALASGETEIAPWPSSEDCQRALEVVQGFGVAIRRSAHAVTIGGCPDGGWRAPAEPLFCGESGTTLRLSAGLAASQPFATTLAAGPLLSRRPMRRVAEPLSRMGAQIDGAGHDAELHPPLLVRGRRPLAAIRYVLPVASAQVKSAILLAGLFAQGCTTVVEPAPTRDHTERLLRHFGASVRSEGSDISVEPGTLSSPGRLALPGDFSSAAFFLVAASGLPGARLTIGDVGLNPSRTALLGVLKRMGSRIVVAGRGNGEWEPRGALTVDGQPLRAVDVTAEEVSGLIDELPILMVAAACAQGTSRFHGIGELRVKETDRISSMVAGLRALGARVRVLGEDAVEIDGGALRGAEVASAGDHRTAMSLAVAGLLARGTTVVRGAECVAKSFPDFFDRLRLLTPSPTVKTVDKA